MRWNSHDFNHCLKQSSYGNDVRLKQLWLCIPTTRPRWSPSSLFRSLSFRKLTDEKALSSSTEPSTWIMAICANFMYSGKDVDKAEFASRRRQSLVTGLRTSLLASEPTGGGSMAHGELANMAILKSGCSVSSRVESKTGGT